MLILFALFCFVIAGFAFFAGFIALHIWLAARRSYFGYARATTSGRRSGRVCWPFLSTSTHRYSEFLPCNRNNPGTRVLESQRRLLHFLGFVAGRILSGLAKLTAFEASLVVDP
jgi:hypothetical protein